MCLMPRVVQSLFQEKDYMNGRFFHKRAFYLAVIAWHVVQVIPACDVG